MTVERGENGQFKKSTDEKMNEWICRTIQNKPGKRIARRLFDSDAKARMEAEHDD